MLIANLSALITLLSVIVPEIGSQFDTRYEDNKCPFCKSGRRKYKNILGMDEYLCPYCDCAEIEILEQEDQ